jgi:hypothetical protein
MVSNMVLEYELELCNKEISKTKNKHEGKNMHEEIEDRKMQIDIKMQMLVLAVQTGSIDMPTYLSQVKASIASVKKIALVFKRSGKMDLAKSALNRIKIMESEVSQAEEM